MITKITINKRIHIVIRHGNGVGINIIGSTLVSCYPTPNPAGIETLPPDLPQTETGFPALPPPAKLRRFR